MPAYQRQRSDSAFVAALNSHQEAFDGVDYTVAYTWGDEIVVDALDHDGHADPARIDVGVCAQAFMPGVDPATLPATGGGAGMGALLLGLLAARRSAGRSWR